MFSFSQHTAMSQKRNRQRQEQQKSARMHTDKLATDTSATNSWPISKILRNEKTAVALARQLSATRQAAERVWSSSRAKL